MQRGREQCRESTYTRTSVRASSSGCTHSVEGDDADWVRILCFSLLAKSVFLSHSSHQEVLSAGELHTANKTHQGDVTERVELREVPFTLPKPHTGIVGSFDHKVYIE